MGEIMFGTAGVITAGVVYFLEMGGVGTGSATKMHIFLLYVINHIYLLQTLLAEKFTRYSLPLKSLAGAIISVPAT